VLFPAEEKPGILTHAPEHPAPSLTIGKVHSSDAGLFNFPSLIWQTFS
jgi:hypothetical protein